MRKLLPFGLAGAFALLAAATSADTLPLVKVPTPTTTSQPPRLMVLPKLTIAPLSASALSAAKAQLFKTYPRAQTTSNPPGPLYLDVTHWVASSGPLSGSLALGSVAAVGVVDPSSPPGWQTESGGGAIVTLNGLQPNALYLLDFAAQASDGSVVNLNLCWNNNPIACMTGGATASGSMSFASGHAIFGFMAQQGSAVLFVSNIPSSAIAAGFTLHPAS